MSPTTTPASTNQDRKYVPGLRSGQSVSLTVKDGRAYLGAKGWNFETRRVEVVSLEVDAIGLQNLAATAKLALDALLTAPVAAPAPSAAA